MNLESIPEGLRNPYLAQCPCCGITQTLLTQGENSPEYYAEVYLQCQCGEYLEFELPVN
jgi:hypothetical protein